MGFSPLVPFYLYCAIIFSTTERDTQIFSYSGVEGEQRKSALPFLEKNLPVFSRKFASLSLKVLNTCM